MTLRRATLAWVAGGVLVALALLGATTAVASHFVSNTYGGCYYTGYTEINDTYDYVDSQTGQETYAYCASVLHIGLWTWNGSQYVNVRQDACPGSSYAACGVWWSGTTSSAYGYHQIQLSPTLWSSTLETHSPH